MRLYYKTGTFSGFETDPTAWTELNYAPVTSFFTNAGGQWGRLSTKGLMLKAGQTYELFYMATDLSKSVGNSIWSQSGGATVSNDDITVIGGSLIIEDFWINTSAF